MFKTKKYDADSLLAFRVCRLNSTAGDDRRGKNEGLPHEIKDSPQPSIWPQTCLFKTGKF